MADHGIQMPMFPDPEAQMLELARHGIHAAQVALQLAEMLHQRSLNGLVPVVPAEVPVAQAVVPDKPAPRPFSLQEWRDFVAEMQGYERALRDPDKPHARLKKIAIAAEAHWTDRHLRRKMEDFGLRPMQWPPSTWDPENPPRAPRESGH